MQRRDWINTASPGYVEIVQFGRLNGSLFAFFACAAVLAPLLALGSHLTVAMGLIACAAATFTAPRLWTRYAANGVTFRRLGGALAGLLTPIIAHLAMFVVSIGFWWLDPAAFDGAVDAMARVTGGPEQSVVVLALLSAGAVGWLTVPAGVIGGVIVTLMCRRRLRRLTGRS